MIRSNARAALSLAGVISLVGAAVSAELAWAHMRWMAATYGVICGAQGLPHCAACPTALALLGIGLALLTAAAMARPEALRPRAR